MLDPTYPRTAMVARINEVYIGVVLLERMLVQDESRDIRALVVSRDSIAMTRHWQITELQCKQTAQKYLRIIQPNIRSSLEH
jgi:hypothetical protein